MRIDYLRFIICIYYMRFLFVFFLFANKLLYYYIIKLLYIFLDLQFIYLFIVLKRLRFVPLNNFIKQSFNSKENVPSDSVQENCQSNY